MLKASKFERMIFIVNLIFFKICYPIYIRDFNLEKKEKNVSEKLFRHVLPKYKTILQLLLTIIKIYIKDVYKKVRSINKKACFTIETLN